MEVVLFEGDLSDAAGDLFEEVLSNEEEDPFSVGHFSASVDMVILW